MTLAEAIRHTEYKYFGDYEFSDAQREAVDVLVAYAQRAEQAEAALAQMTKERDDAVKFLGRMAEDLVNAGGRFGDREVALANLRAVIAERDVLKAELAKHAHCIEEIQADQLLVANRENELHDAKDAQLADANALGTRLAERCTYGGLFIHRLGCTDPDKPCRCGRSQDEADARAAGWLKEEK